MVDPMAEDFEDLTPYNYASNNPIRNIDPDGMESMDAYGNLFFDDNELGGPKKLLTKIASSNEIKNGKDDDGKKEPELKPVELKEVVIKSGPHKGMVAVTIIPWIGNYPSHIEYRIPEAAAAYNRALIWSYLSRFTELGKTVSIISSILDMTKNTNRNQVAHHIKPLADGGEDGYPNIEPKPATEHMDWHKALGDFIRWGSKRAQDID